MKEYSNKMRYFLYKINIVSSLQTAALIFQLPDRSPVKLVYTHTHTHTKLLFITIIEGTVQYNTV